MREVTIDDVEKTLSTQIDEYKEETKEEVVEEPVSEAAQYLGTKLHHKIGGYVETDKNTVDVGDDIATLTAKVIDCYFVGWEIEGEYEIIEGNLISPIIKINPKSDIIAVAVFKGGENSEPILNNEVGNTSLISPKTGQEAYKIYIILGIMCFVTLITMFSFYRVKKH